MDRARRADAAAAALIVLAAALIRFPLLRAEPWFDEIWSMTLARGAASVWAVFRDVHMDNSHTLNTLYLHLLGPDAGWAADRMLSFVSGLAVVALLAVEPGDRRRGLLAAALAALSVPMILHSAEARGYAPLALFATACFLLLSPDPAPPARRAAAFWACAVLGFLSQLLFVFVLAALLVWTWVRLPERERTTGLLKLFGPPLAVCAFFGVLQLGGLRTSGGTPAAFPATVLLALARAAGAPDAGPAAWAGAALFAGLVGRGLWELRRDRSPEFWFHSVLFAATFAFIAVLPYRFDRYAFACLPFALMLAARPLARLFRSGPPGAAAAAVLLALYALGGAARARALAADGNGRYLEAVRHMAEVSPGGVVRVGSDHEFRNGSLLKYYAAYLPPGKSLYYVPDDAFVLHPPDWFLRHTFDTDPRLAPVGLSFFDGKAVYRLDGVYPYAGMSGWSWLLYRRVAPDPI